MENLSSLPNIGKKLQRQLNEAGIFTVSELLNLGSKQAWLKIKLNDPSACINRLYALEGAIQGINRHALPQHIKAELKEFYNLIK